MHLLREGGWELAAHTSANHSCLGHGDLNTPHPTGLAQLLFVWWEKVSLHRPASQAVCSSSSAFQESPQPGKHGWQQLAQTTHLGTAFPFPTQKAQRATAFALGYFLSWGEAACVGRPHSTLTSAQPQRTALATFANTRNNALQSGWKIHLEHMRHFRLLHPSKSHINPSECKQMRAVSSLWICTKHLVF